MAREFRCGRAPFAAVTTALHDQHPELKIVRVALDYRGYETFCVTPRHDNLGKSAAVQRGRRRVSVEARSQRDEHYEDDGASPSEFWRPSVLILCARRALAGSIGRAAEGIEQGKDHCWSPYIRIS